MKLLIFIHGHSVWYLFVCLRSSSSNIIHLHFSSLIFKHPYSCSFMPMKMFPRICQQDGPTYSSIALFIEKGNPKHALHYLKISCQIEYNTQYCQEEKVQELFVRVRRRYGGGTGGKADEVGSEGASTVGTDLGPDSGTASGPSFWYRIWSRLWNQNGFKKWDQ